MGEVNWDNVPKPQQEVPEKSGSGWIGTVVFVILLVIGLVVGGGYLNHVMLGERVRDLVVDECGDSTCVVDVRAAHVDCYGANVTYAPPTSAADFQTPATSPKLGIGTVDLEGYRACVMPGGAPETLADDES